MSTIKSYSEGVKIMQDKLGSILTSVGRPLLLLQIMAGVHKAPNNGPQPRGWNDTSSAIARLFWGANDKNRVVYLGQQARLDPAVEAAGVITIPTENRNGPAGAYRGLALNNNNISLHHATLLFKRVIKALFGSDVDLADKALDTLISMGGNFAYNKFRELVLKATETTTINLDWCRFAVLKVIMSCVLGTHIGTTKPYNADFIGSFLRQGITVDDYIGTVIQAPIGGFWSREKRDRMKEIAVDVHNALNKDPEPFFKAIEAKKKLTADHENIVWLMYTGVEALSAFPNLACYLSFETTFKENVFKFRTSKGIQQTAVPTYTITLAEVKQIARYMEKYPNDDKHKLLERINYWAYKQDLRPASPGRSIDAFRAILRTRKSLIKKYREEYSF